mgnify:CR=1 FL=1
MSIKRLLFFLALSGLSFCQTLTQSSSATSQTRGADLSNIGLNPAIGWRLNFWYTGFTAATVELDCAPDSGTGTAGTYAACGGAVDGTTNPVTIAATPQSGTIALKTYTPHIAVNPSSLTGTGTIHWNLTGLFGASNAPTTITTSGGSSGPTPVTTACTGQIETALSGTGYTTIIAASGSTVISLCNLAVTSASGGVPNVNTFTLAFGTCGSSPTEIENISGVTGYTDQFFGSLAGTAGQAFCMKEATANSDKVFASFLQK